jgi:hypothetical protein
VDRSRPWIRAPPPTRSTSPAERPWCAHGAVVERDQRLVSGSGMEPDRNHFASPFKSTSAFSAQEKMCSAIGRTAKCPVRHRRLLSEISCSLQTTTAPVPPRSPLRHSLTGRRRGESRCCRHTSRYNRGGNLLLLDTSRYVACLRLTTFLKTYGSEASLPRAHGKRALVRWSGVPEKARSPDVSAAAGWLRCHAKSQLSVTVGTAIEGAHLLSVVLGTRAWGD